MSETDESDSDHIYLSESDSDISDKNNSEESRTSDENDVDLAQNWHNINTDPLHPAPPRFPFVGIPGCTFSTTNNLDVLEYFQLFFDDGLVDEITNETNRYAIQQPGTSTRIWTRVTRDEMQIFFAIILIQGIIKKPDIKMYWSTNEIFCSPIFPRLMNRGRFLDIKKYLHFSNNECYDPKIHPNPKLNKIWPVYENINQKCSSLYIPERDITIDESLLLYKGRLGWVQYLPLKRARFGIKLYLLCESKSGYLFSSIIYTGKGTIICDKYKDMPMASQVVLSLLEPLLDMGYCLTTDNYYTSPQLADYLILHKTDIYGTMRANKRDIPIEIKNTRLKKGEIIAFQRGKVMVMKWRDKKEVCLLSTIHNPKQTKTNKTDKSGNLIVKPALVIDYNDTMGGVDRLDQHLHDYPLTRKRGKKYYKKIFFHLLDVSVWNSFILYKKNGGSRNHLDFRQTIIQQLIEKYHGSSLSRKVGRPIQPGSLRLTERHFPEFIPPTEKKPHPVDVVLFVLLKVDKKLKESERKQDIIVVLATLDYAQHLVLKYITQKQIFDFCTIYLLHYYLK